MNKLKLHEKPSKNSSGIFFQAVSTDESENILFANAYGETKKQAKERGVIISLSYELIDALVKAELDFNLLGIKEHAPMRKNIIDLLNKLK